MSLFDEGQSEPAEPVRPRHAARYIIIGLLAAAGAYVASTTFRSEAPATVTRPAPPPVPVPAPEPVPEPAPVRARPPRRVPRPEPKPEVEPTPLLPPAPLTGVLRVSSDVDGASVFLDRRYLGTTPIDRANLEPGPHRLNVSAEGYDGFAETIEISDAPVDVSVKFREVRLDLAIPVVHKHRIGSCEGRLRATLQGIQYDTPHRKDAFSLPFADIEAFEVDYLKHTLTLKRRGGKRYRFTDRRENADALFVFHRDVEKARARLVTNGVPAGETR